MAEGREEGFVRGREFAVADVVIRLLTKRFGTLSEEVQDSIRSLDVRALEGLSEALLDFSSLDELDSWLQSGE